MATTGQSIRRRARIVGRVQGVGFRESCRREARALGVAGTARNLADGSVGAVFEGSRHSSSRCCRGAIAARAWRTSATSRSRRRHRLARQASPSGTGSRRTATLASSARTHAPWVHRDLQVALVRSRADAMTVPVMRAGRVIVRHGDGRSPREWRRARDRRARRGPRRRQDARSDAGARVRRRARSRGPRRR